MKSLAMQKQLKVRLLEGDQKTLKIKFRPAIKPVQFSEDGFETDRYLLGQPIREDVKIQTQQPAEILSDSPPGEINSVDGLLSVLGSKEIVLIQGKRYIFNLASRSSPSLNIDQLQRSEHQSVLLATEIITSSIGNEILQEPKPLQVIQFASVQEETKDLDDFYASLTLSIGQYLEPALTEQNNDGQLDEFYAALAQSLKSEVENFLPEPAEDLDQFYASLSLDIARQLRPETEKQEILEDDFYAQLSLNLAIDLPQKSEEDNGLKLESPPIANLTEKQNSEDEFYSQLALKLSEDLELLAYYDKCDAVVTQPSATQQNDQVNLSPSQFLDKIKSSLKSKIHEKKKVVLFSEEQPPESPDRKNYESHDRQKSVNKLVVAVAKKAHTLNAANQMLDFQFDQILGHAATLREVKKERFKKEIQEDQSWFKKVQEKLIQEDSSLPAAKQIETQSKEEEICLSSSSDSICDMDSPFKRSNTQLFANMKTKFLTDIAQKFAFQMGIESTKFDFSKQQTIKRQETQRKILHVGQLLEEDLASEDRDLNSVVKSLQVQMACLKSMVKLSWEDSEHHSKSIKKISLNEINNRKLTETIVEKLNSKVKTFQTLFDKMQYKTKLLHFAFLFACPLVMSFQGPQTTKTQYKLVPALNYQQEFQRIQNHLSRAKIKCGVMKRSCTIDNLKEILGHQPIGMHFSGHGILNNFESVGDYHYLHKDEGDFLLMETAEGDSQLVSRLQLQKLIQATETNLEFVFIATCHSEFVGQIFKQAGAKNVICIDENHEVQDSAIILFTDMFYGSIFTNVPVPVAFQQAKLLVSIKFDEKEASIFKLLRRSEKQENQVHCFGPFDEGMWVCHDIPVAIQNQTPKVALLVGRQKDMFKIIEKVMSEKSSRLITLLGLPGVGKTALIRNTVHYIQERRLFQGGCIFSNAQNIKDAKDYVSALISQVIKETRDIPDCDGLESLIEEGKTVLDQLNSLFFYIAKLKGQLLYVIDNAEDLITNDKANFRIVIQHILLACSNIKIVITSRFRLVSLPEETEEVLMIGPISMAASVQLFRHFTREIPQSEINELLAIVPDTEKYPQEALKPKPKKLQDHHFFALLGGNPQSIILTSPLLADSEKQLTLSILYKMQTSNQITQMLKRENIEDKMLASLRISIYISIQMLQETDPVCMSLFYLLGMLPGGVTDDELGSLWNCLQEPIPWRTVIQLLQKNQLIVQGQVNGITKNYLPEFIGSYAEAMASDEQKQIYHDVICTVMLRKMGNWYFGINNTRNKDFESETVLVANEMMQVKENIEALIQRMSEKNATSLHAVAIQGDTTKPLRSTIIIDPEHIASFQQELLKSTTLKAKQKKFDLTKILGEALKKHLAKTKEQMNRDNEWCELSSSYNELKKNQLRQKSLQSVMKYNNFSMKFNNTRSSAASQDITKITPIERLRIAVKKVIKDNKEKKNRKKMGFVKISGQKDDDDVEVGTSEDEAPKKDNFFLVVQGMCLDKQTKMEKKIELMASQLNSFKIQNQPEKQKKNFITQQTLKRQSAVVLDLKKQNSQRNEERVSTEEELIIVYLMNLTLLGKSKEATEMISKYFVTFIDWHQVFMGNVYRIKALNQFLIYQQESKALADKEKKDDIKAKFEQVISLYKIAVQLFTACECTWGKGITLFQIALVYKELHYHTETTKYLQQACQEFQKINHYRGLAMCCKHMGTLLARGTKNSEAQSYQQSYQEYLMHFHSGKSKYYNYLSTMRSFGEDYCLQTEIVLIARCQTIFEKENELKMKIARNLLSKVVSTKFQNLEPIDDKSSQEYSPTSFNQSKSASSRSRNSHSNGPLNLEKRQSSEEVLKKIQNKINLFQKLETKIRPIILSYTDSNICQADFALVKDKEEFTENSHNDILSESDGEEQKVSMAIKIETNETLDHQDIQISVSDLKDKTHQASSSLQKYLPQQFEEQSRSFSQQRRPNQLLSPNYRPDSHFSRSFRTNQLLSPNLRQYSRSPLTPPKNQRTPIGFISSKDFF